MKDGEMLSTPESEQNPPADKHVGWKSFNDTQDRFWMGRQWSDTFREKNNDE